MTELSVLDELVPAYEEQPDWNDVLRRARRLPASGRVLAAVVVAVAVFGVAPAVAVVLLRDHGLRWPSQADRSNVVIVMQPRTGRVLMEVAPRKDGNGFCYLVRPLRAGCVARSSQTVFMRPPLLGWTFDARVASGTATLLSGRTVPLFVRHFGGKVDATLFMLRGRLLPRLMQSAVLRDAGGKVIARVRFTR